MSIRILTQLRLKEILHYDCELGIFTRAKALPPYKVGEIAGHKHHRGYINIRVDGRLYWAHRLAWLYVYGAWPKDQLDHINRNREDNRIANLREASNGENQQNRKVQSTSKTGFTGVTFDKTKGKWCARITKDKKLYNLGHFSNLEDAINTHSEAKRKLHTFFNQG